MYAVIVGEQGVGKSSLVNRVAKELSLPVWGFFTKKGAAFSKEMGGFPVYLHQVREAPKDGVQEGEFRERVNEGEKHLVAYCNNRLLQVNKEVFDNFAIKLKEPVPEGHLVMMDELGIMEKNSLDFCNAVLEVLQQPRLGVIVVKHKDSPFLNQVRSHKNCRCFRLTQENREEVFCQIMDFVKGELYGKGRERSAGQCHSS